MTSSSSSAARRGKAAAAVAAVLGVLFVQHWLTFADHWRGLRTFPFDFQSTYHAFPFYWQTVVRAGLWPSWEPFQGAGVPFASMMQTSLYYPPSWFFPLVDLPYSMAAATRFACAHVLFGALGAVFLARVRGVGLGYALVAGIGYHCFGGFFSNASHPDIVRGFALLPWLLASLTPGDDRRLPARAWAIPLWVLLFVTGGYPGQWVGGLLLAGLVVALGYFENDRRDRRGVLCRWALLALGGAVSAVFLLPATLGASELARAEQWRSQVIQGMTLYHFLASPFRYDLATLPLDITMRGVFLPLPLLVGVFFLRKWDLRPLLGLFVTGALAFLLAFGGDVFRLVASVFPPLGYSRFPGADYRAWVAIAVTVAGARGLEAWLSRRIDVRRMLFGVAALVAVVGLGVWSWHGPFGGNVVVAVAGGLGVLLVLGGFAVMGALDRRAALVAVLALTAWDGWSYHHDQPIAWNLDLGRRDDEGARRQLLARLRSPPAIRPPRDDGGSSLDGYLRGRYLWNDYAASEHFRFYQALRQSPALAAYVRSPSDPRLVSRSAVGPEAFAGSPQGSARSLRQGVVGGRYQVQADSDAILVENEPASPGWSARICGGAALAKAPALWPLRAWQVPAGEHQICVRHVTPGLRAGAAVSVFAALVWLAAALFSWRRRRAAVPARSR